MTTPVNPLVVVLRLLRHRTWLFVLSAGLWGAVHALPVVYGLVMKGMFDALSGTAPAGVSAWTFLALALGTDLVRLAAMARRQLLGDHLLAGAGAAGTPQPARAPAHRARHAAASRLAERGRHPLSGRRRRSRRLRRRLGRFRRPGRLRTGIADGDDAGEPDHDRADPDPADPHGGADQRPQALHSNDPQAHAPGHWARHRLHR